MTTSGYIVAKATMLHTYPRPRNHGKPWQATYEYCCRSDTLQNNKDTT